MSYIQYNANPKDRKIGDCVVRAISKACNETWHETYEGLYQIGYKKCRMPNDNKTYGAYLKEKGFSKQPALRDEDGKMVTVKELAEYYTKKYNHFTLLVHTRSHLTCVVDGNIYDIWNTSAVKAGKYFIKL